FRVLRLVLFRNSFEAMETLLIHSPRFFVHTDLYLLRIDSMNYLDRLPCPLLVHH
ncbi:hypothetical protein K435DRAFT_783970, partial [Dendrothele bispora CBS 962.96]